MAASKSQQKAITEEQKQHSKQDDGEMETSTLDKEAADSDAKSTDLEEDFPECIHIDEDVLENLLKCGICLEIKTEVRAIKACYHRICKDCIYKQLRVGKKWCPFCKVSCPTLRSTMKDVKFSAFITDFLPYLKNEDCKLTDADKSRNAQLQASISAINSKQQESIKKRKRNA